MNLFNFYVPVCFLLSPTPAKYWKCPIKTHFVFQCHFHLCSCDNMLLCIICMYADGRVEDSECTTCTVFAQILLGEVTWRYLATASCSGGVASCRGKITWRTRVTWLTGRKSKEMMVDV